MVTGRSATPSGLPTQGVELVKDLPLVPVSAPRQPPQDKIRIQQAASVVELAQEFDAPRPHPEGSHAHPADDVLIRHPPDKPHSREGAEGDQPEAIALARKLPHQLGEVTRLPHGGQQLPFASEAQEPVALVHRDQPFLMPSQNFGWGKFFAQMGMRGMWRPPPKLFRGGGRSHGTGPRVRAGNPHARPCAQARGQKERESEERKARKALFNAPYGRPFLIPNASPSAFFGCGSCGKGSAGSPGR